MKLPPVSKISREAARIRDQLSRKAANVYEVPLRILHDKWLLNKARPLAGKWPLGSKVAILVVFQPKGIARSLFLTCDHLIDQGYSPFILCNTTLSEDDRVSLLERSALLLERPNFGYDFGAYQDGIRMLSKLGCIPDRLILMNDSTWFPLRSDDTSIARMEASRDSFTGHAFRNETNIGRKRDHMEAHLLMFDRASLECKGFQEFWDQYPASSNRITTIEKGEKGITAAMLNAGFASEGLASRQLLNMRLEDASFETLHKILVKSSFHSTKFEPRTLQLLAKASNSYEWRKQALDLVADHLNHVGPVLSTTLIYGAMMELHLGFVKKSPEEQFHIARTQVLKLEASGEIEPLHLDVRSEMRVLVETWGGNAG